MLQTHQQYDRPKKTHRQQKLVKSNSYNSARSPNKPIRVTSIDHHKKRRSSCRRVSAIKEDDDIPLALLAYKKGYQLSMASSSSTAVDQRIQSLLSTESSSCSHTSLIKPASPPLVTTRPKQQHIALEGKKKKPRPRKHPSSTTTVIAPTVPPPPKKKKKRLSFSIHNWFSSIRKLLVR